MTCLGWLGVVNNMDSPDANEVRQAGLQFRILLREARGAKLESLHA
jgi:hypothetical protein